MEDDTEKLQRMLRESQDSQKRLMQKVTELEKQLKDLEFHHRTTSQLLLSIMDMDDASGGDRSSLRRHIKILSIIHDHMHDMDEIYVSEISCHDILQSIVNSPQEFSLPPQAIQICSFFDSVEDSFIHHTLDTQTALIMAICISDILAGLLKISDIIFLHARHLTNRDNLWLRCKAGVNSRLAEEILNQILQGAFFSLLQDRVSITFLPPNPREGPGLEMNINYDYSESPQTTQA